MSEAAQQELSPAGGVSLFNAPSIQTDDWVACRNQAIALLQARGPVLVWLFGLVFGIAYAVIAKDTTGWMLAGSLVAFLLLVVGAGNLKFWVTLYPLVFLSPDLSLGKWMIGGNQFGLQLYEPWTLLLFCLWIPRLLATKRIELPGHLKGMLAALLGIGLLGLGLAPNPLFALRVGVTNFFEPLLLFMVVSSLSWHWSELRRIVCVLACVAILAAIFSIFEYGTRGGGESVGDLARLGSYWGGPNVLAVFLSVAITVALGWVLSVSPKTKIEALTCLATLLLAGVALVLTYTRGAWIAIGLALAFMTIQLRVWLWGLLAVLLIILGLLTIAPPQVVQRATSIVNFNQERSAVNRLELWSKVVRIIADRPLTGYGFSGFFTLFRYRYDIRSYHAHNVFLDYAVSLGVPALLLFLWLVGSILFRALRTFRQYRWTEDSPFLIGLCAACLTILGAGMTDASLLVWASLDHLFWFTLALTYTFTVTLERDLSVP